MPTIGCLGSVSFFIVHVAELAEKRNQGSEKERRQAILDQSSLNGDVNFFKDEHFLSSLQPETTTVLYHACI